MNEEVVATSHFIILRNCVGWTQHLLQKLTISVTALHIVVPQFELDNVLFIGFAAHCFMALHYCDRSKV